MTARAHDDRQGHHYYIRRLRRPTHTCIVVMTLAVIMVRRGGHHVEIAFFGKICYHSHYQRRSPNLTSQEYRAICFRSQKIILESWKQRMDIQITNKALHNLTCDALVVGAATTKTEQGMKQVVLSETAKTVDNLLGGLLSQICTDDEFKGGLGEMATVYTMGRLEAKRIILVGLGTQETLNTQSLRRACAVATRHLQSTGAHVVGLALGGQEFHIDGKLAAQAQVEGSLLGLYTFKKYQRQDTNSNGRAVTKLQLVAGDAHVHELDEAVRRGTILAEATNFARDLVNEPPNVLTPTELANRASAMAMHFRHRCYASHSTIEACHQRDRTGFDNGEYAQRNRLSSR